MGACCGKQQPEPSGDIQEEKKPDIQVKPTKVNTPPSVSEPKLNVEEYKFVNKKDEWTPSPPTSLTEDGIHKISEVIMCQSTRTGHNDSQLPPGGVSNVLMFDANTGAEILRVARNSQELREFEGGIATEFYRTQIGNEEKLAVVFKNSIPGSGSPDADRFQGAVATFLEKARQLVGDVVDQQAPVMIAYDKGRPMLVKPIAKVPETDIKSEERRTSDRQYRYQEFYGKFFKDTPGHIRVPESPEVEQLPLWKELMPGWCTMDNLYCYIILIERDEGGKYLRRLCSNPATSLLTDDVQGDFFQCVYSGLEMLGLRLYHAKNLIQKVDKAARFILDGGLNEVKSHDIHTDFDFKVDAFNIEKCCHRLNLDENETARQKQLATY